MKAFLKFNRGILGMPIGWQLWIVVLVLFNLVAPLLFVARWEAQLVLLTFIAGALLMVLLTARFGFTRILGLGHILWVPLVALLIGRLSEIPGGDLYGLWLRSLIVINSISLVLDAVDVIRYFRGEREEIVADL